MGPLQHFLLFPAYKFCERKLAITRFQKKKNQEREKEKPTKYKRPSREATASAVPKMARLSASGLRTGKPLATPWSQKRSPPTSADRRTSRNGRSEKTNLKLPEFLWKKV